MNEIARSAKAHATTQTADGLPRLKWTLEEFERLSELGFFGGIDRDRERLELIDGELLPMNAKGARHELVRAVILNHLVRKLQDGFDFYSEPGWRPGGDLYLEPEMLICKAGFQPATVPPCEVLLLIEVSDTSISYDFGLKAKIYASLGVREYWVINAKTLETTVHRQPGESGYFAVVTLPASDTIVPQALPDLTLSLGALKIS